jgi:hypothetical protein
MIPTCAALLPCTLTTRAMIVPSPFSGWYTKWKPSELVIIVPCPAPATVNVPFAKPALPANPTAPTSWSNQDAGSGCVVTVKRTALLSFIPGATDTSNGPDVAPAGIVIVIDVLLQLLIVTAEPFSKTVLLPCGLPNPLPEITTWLPTDPVVAETPLITGAGAAAELTDTLSNVAVAKEAVVRLLTASPTYTFAAMLTVWLVPNGTQFTPSADPYMLNTFPLRTSFIQFGSVALPTNW